MARLLKQEEKEHVNYNRFKEIALILVEFSNNTSDKDIEELCQDWYVMYKEQKYNIDAAEWIKHHLSILVSRDTHDFWISPRGVYLWEISKMAHHPFPAS